MLNMKEKALLVLVISFAVALTASLIRASWTYEVRLVTHPRGSVLSAPAGEPLNVSCQASGGDEGKFSSMEWLDSEEKVIEEGIPGVVRGDTNLLFLTFTHPKTEDSGTYRCKAVYDNEYNIQYITRIVFYGPEPEFELGFENRTVTEGENVEVYCSALGERPMTYNWYDQSGDRIPEFEGRPIFVSSSLNGSWLIIPEVKLRHHGMYTCTANNTHGLSSKLYYLGVSPQRGNGTDSLLQDVLVVNVSSSSVRFRIVVNGSAAGVEVRYGESRDGVEYSSRLPLASNSIYRVDDLLPGGLYSFQFRTLPSEGNDTWSRVYRVTLLPDVPEIIIRSLAGRSIQLEWFRKVDDIMRQTIDKHEITYYSVGIQGGNSWIPSDCAITIQIPTCSGPSYTISGLQQNTYYQLEVRAHTASGYGEPSAQKIYLPG